MRQPRSPLQQTAARANGARSRGPTTAAGKARAARNGTRHGLCGGSFALLPGEDAQELAALHLAVTADWAPPDAYERRWVRELVVAYWRQDRLRGLELAALAAAEDEAPPSEASLKRLLTFARYGARIDGDIGRALRALRVLRDRPDGQSARDAGYTPEPEPPPAEAAAPEPTSARTSEPGPPSSCDTEATAPMAPLPLNRHQRRRLEALQRLEQRRAA